MLGIFLNLLMVASGSLALATSISFFIHEPESGYIRGYTLHFGSAIFMICTGYVFMAFTENLNYAYIPRFFGLAGIDLFLIIELSFLLRELNIRNSFHFMIIACLLLYFIFDMLIFGSKNALNYVRYNSCTAYENTGDGKFAFHYIFMLIMACILFYFGIKWYKSKKIHRDKVFALEVICANFIVIFATIPDVMHSVFSAKYPTFPYSIALSFVYFSWWFACRWHITYRPNVKNVSRQVYDTLDIPILIFDMDGNVCIQNPCATKKFNISEGEHPSIRDLFAFSDVETMVFLKNAREGTGEKTSVRMKTTNQLCVLTTNVQFDNAGEPFCIIGAVFQGIEEQEALKVENL